MFESNILDYMQEAKKNCLTKIEIVLETDPELAQQEFNVVKTKETYTFSNEEDADTLIDKMRQDSRFIGCDKKFKQGRISKSGEELRPDTWTVVVKLNHCDY